MASREDLIDWVYKAVQANGGRTKLVNVSRHIWENHEPERPRKLLLHRSEIERLIGRTQERGLTIVPTRLYFSGPRSRAKVEIAIARGKDLYDKRESIRKREMARDVQRELREAQR